MPKEGRRFFWGILTKIRKLPGFFRGTHAYRKRYGFFKGLRMALQLHRAGHLEPIGSVGSIKVPSLRSPILIRSQTTDVSVFWQIFGIRPFDIEFREPAQFIVDAGAHIGLTSIYLANRFPNARIVALEAEAGNYSLLKQNTAEYETILPLHKALWSKESRVRINDTSVDTWSFSVSEVPVDTADYIPAVGVADIMRENKFDGIDLLKIDIEGAEREVFSHDYESWIGRVGVMFVELHDRHVPGCTSAFQKAIAGRGFEITEHGEYIVVSNSHFHFSDR